MIDARRLLVAGVTALLVAGLAACGGGSGDSGQSGAAKAAQASPDGVRGLKDTVRHVSRKTVYATRPHLVRRCRPATRQVRHTSRSGSGTHRTTRVWYTTEHYQSCTQVRKGTERYRRVVRQERWCVSLDDVDGVRTQDDVWYEVDRQTYGQVLDAGDHAPVRFVPAGTGC
ncbi:hypothetical protein [Streptomyces gilvus]|uniref:hypothetical protein n=1 Tax=Streptomyces gilvus TaxID=2920937 RepID=UPI001F0FEEE1|nr:hypothetical protein [Streptomyces sp. CME 23]MCH5670886.1 hypothetical protein [Streptomyces sp. CME 23]